MLTDDDKQTIKEIFDKAIDRVENKIDKVLKIVTTSNQEHAITKAKVNKLEKRTTKIEKKVGIKPPISTTVFA